MIHELAKMWQGRTTESGKQPDGTADPLDDIKVHAVVTPEQWETLGRNGAPDSLGAGPQKAREAAIAALDR